MHPQSITPALLERFWSKVERATDCWLWTGAGARSGPGYGRIEVDGRLLGAIPPGGCILHTCDNRACVRNDEPGWYEVDGAVYPRLGHLVLATKRANLLDALAKGRALSVSTRIQAHPELVPRGESHWMRRMPERIARGEHHGTHTHPERYRGRRVPTERLARGDRNGARLHPETLERGEQRYNAKLNEAIVRAIRQRVAQGARLQHLAAEYGVSPRLIGLVARGEAWRHVS
jgi:hypothetical protein